MIPPPPPPPPLPSYPPDDLQRRTDADHLNLLSVFHLIWGLLALLGILGLWAHWLLMTTVFKNFPVPLQHFAADVAPQSLPQVRVPFPTDAITGIMQGFYIVAVAFCVIAGVLNLMAWRNLKARRARTLTLVTAGLNCLAMPVGTVLGVFTFIVLLRPSVKDLYDAGGPDATR